jgi:erythromycin esterase-like protein
MLRGDDKSWTIREKHMAETLDRLLKFHGKNSKVIVWAHNTHIGDARGAPVKGHRLLSLGQLIRKKHEKKGVVLIGLSAYQGETIAGETWESPMKKMSMPPSHADSWEFALHRAFGTNRMLLFGKEQKRSKLLKEFHLQRAIGVVYQPEMEAKNYLKTSITQRYDALLFIDRATALNPLAVGEFQKAELPETFPTSL